MLNVKINFFPTVVFCLMQNLNVDLKGSPNVHQDTNRSSPVETEPRSTIRHHSRTSKVIQKSSEGQVSKLFMHSIFVDIIPLL